MTAAPGKPCPPARAFCPARERTRSDKALKKLKIVMSVTDMTREARNLWANWNEASPRPALAPKRRRAKSDGGAANFDLRPRQHSGRQSLLS